MIHITCSAILFDMDGVLIDSTPTVARVWWQWAMEHGFNAEEVVNKAHGRPSIATVRDYLPDADHEAEDREIERREIEDMAGIVSLPGTHALLSSLRPDQWAIVTSCTRALAEVRVRAGGLPIPPVFLTSGEVQNGKPHPEPYEKGAAALGFSSSDCVVVEDVPAGVHAGKAAGARVIGLRTTVSDTELRDAGADWVLKDCSAIHVVPGKRGRGLVLALDYRA